jgi:signal peptidase II
MRRISIFYYFSITLAIVLIDQISKSLIVKNLHEGDTISVIGNLLNFHFIFNQGGAMGSNVGPPWAYAILTTVALILIVRYFIRSLSNDVFTKVSLALILGGAIGNLIDRVRFGKVVDFIDVDFPDIPFLHLYRWFTFNVADAAITIGLILFAISIIFKSPKEDGPVDGSPTNGSSPDNPERETITDNGPTP